MILAVRDQTWYAGTTAQEHSAYVTGQRDPEWFLSPQGEVLLCAALSQLMRGSGEMILATGLPVEDWHLHDKMRYWLECEHTFKRAGRRAEQRVMITNALICTQGMGALLNQALDDQGCVRNVTIPGTSRTWAQGTVGVIDIGGQTINLVAAQGLREIQRMAHGGDFGLLRVLDAIGRDIKADCPGFAPQAHDVGQYMASGNFHYKGQDRPIAPYAMSHLQALAEMIWGQVHSAWTELGRLDVILCTGGGALALGSYLKEQLNGWGQMFTVSTNPVYDNVLGYQKLLRYRERRKAA